MLADVIEGKAESAAADQVLDPSEQRARLFAAVRTLFTRVGERWPLVLVVDDLQWTDSDSLALLLDVLRPPSAPRLLFVATMRGGARAGAGGRPVDEQIARIEGDVRHIHVEKLPSVDAEALVAFLLGVSDVAHGRSLDRARGRGAPALHSTSSCASARTTGRRPA